MLAEGQEIKEEGLKELNAQLRDKTPIEIVSWVYQLGLKAVVTTNFRPYEGAILHACSSVDKDIKVIWCDTGYNTPNTYECADKIIDQLKLNIDLYVPKQTSAYRDKQMGIPSIDDERHSIFTEQVKLEPFQRAMEEHKPEVWFTNLRKGQTELRNSLDILSLGKDGIIKVSPFYHYSDEELDTYMAEHKLPNEFKYFDPTKALDNRECGLHT